MRKWNIFGQLVLFIHTLFNLDHNWYEDKNYICCSCGLGENKGKSLLYFQILRKRNKNNV